MATPEHEHCSNPFFPCLNTKKELHISVDICVKGEKYAICDCCWPEIAESEDYQWTQPTTEKTDQPIEVDWSGNGSDEESNENDG